MLENKRILITGGAGFIGTALTERLFHNNQCIILDNLHRNAIQQTGLLNETNVQLITANVMDYKAVQDAIKGCHIVVHLASIAGVDTVMSRPVETMEISLIGTYNVLKACSQEPRIERCIDFSTSEVFGRYAYKVTEGDITKLGAVGEARWTYAVSKLATEHLAYNYYKANGLPTVSIRPFNIYGPRQVGEGAVHHFIVRALKGEPLVIHNDGSQIRSWCYIDDIIDGILMTMQKPQAVGHAFNIGNPRSTVTIYHLAQLIVLLSKSTAPIEFIPWNFPDVELRVPDIAKARNLLGYQPKIDLEEGLLRTIAWYRSTLEQ